MSYLGRTGKLSQRAYNKLSFLATAGQTVKAGLSYVAGFVEVYVNGTLLTDVVDYSASNGNSVTFLVALSVDDEVTVVSLKTFVAANMLPLSGGTLNGDLGVTGSVTADGLVVDGGALIQAGNTLTLNRTDNATGGEVSYVAGTGFILNDVNGDGTSFNVGTANRMRIDSSGNIQQGAYSDSTIKNFNMRSTNAIFNIAVDGATGGAGTTINYSWANGGQGPLKFSDASSERMRIDSSGNLLVGKTTTSFGAAGIEARSGGTLWATASGTNAASFNRLLTDGPIAYFSKDSTAVGSIGSAANGTEVYLTGAGANTSGIFCSNGNALLSMKAGVLANGTQDLGSSSYKFKDLYLSDGAYASFIAGQGDANTSINFPGSDVITFNNGGLEAMRIDAAGNVEISTGDVLPGTSTQDLGSVTSPWQNVYTQDLVLSNESRAEGNSVDGTKGNWTIQEGEEHLYIINNKNGKKYKFALEEIM